MLGEDVERGGVQAAETCLKAPWTQGACAIAGLEGTAGGATVVPSMGDAYARPLSHAPVARTRGELAKLTIAALGVVYGDIGTSPLYSMRECFLQPHGVLPTPENVLGIVSLMTWSLLLVVVIKYLSFIMRADNHGEGGILALLALVRPASGSSGETWRRRQLLRLGLIGAALLFGDSIITPAVSVLGAVEGLSVATSAFDNLIVPVTLVILLSLFLVQRHGTAGVGSIFGPATLVWFGTITATGLPWILRHPIVLTSLNPVHALRFFANNGHKGFLTLGSVVLCITGAEALYADMGHFGKRPIRVAWYWVVLPALLVNYHGQAALLLERGSAVENPFYELVSGWLVYPVLVIATVAAVVASQALISGAFSLTHQAVQLGYCPRANIVHTSGQAEGQIYIPGVNYALMIACVTLVLGFKRSSELAAAYGIAVTGTMAITSLLYGAVTRQWGWPTFASVLLVGLFLTVDLGFLTANVHKIMEGGWVPLAVAAALYTLMTTWKTGRDHLRDALTKATMPLDVFIEDVERMRPHRVPGTAVFMTSNVNGTPLVLLHHFKHSKILHQQVVLLSVQTVHVPEVPRNDRATYREIGHGVYVIEARFGFMQTPNVMEVLALCRERGLMLHENDTSFYLGRETLLTSGPARMWRWRKQLFAILSRNARPATSFFGLPPNRVVEMGTQIEL
jgi:KUP system potassium uptake protein